MSMKIYNIYEKPRGSRGLLKFGAIITTIGLGYALYTIAKKYWVKSSAKAKVYSLLGLAAVISLPKTIDVANETMKRHYEYKKYVYVAEMRRDSMINAARIVAEKNNADVSMVVDNALAERDAIEKKNSAMYADSSRIYVERINAERKESAAKIDNLSSTVASLKNEVSTLKNSKSTSAARTTNSNSVAAASNTPDLEKRVYGSSASNSSNGLRYGSVYESYVIDADKSEGYIQVYGVRADGSLVSLNLSSKASFAKNGGPANGQYSLTDTGPKIGDLYPGFMVMDYPIGISGEGQNGEHSEEISNGDFANRTGIRIFNSVYAAVSRLASTNPTYVIVHD